MNQSAPDDEKLFEEALDLIIRLQNDPSNPVTFDLIRRWRCRSGAHEAVWAEAAELHGMAGKVLTDQRTAQRGPEDRSRRKIVLGGVALLAATGAGALYGPDAILRARADHMTATAELSSIALADGTTVTLGPQSAIRTLFTPSARRVELLSGMAFFEVAHDKSRPFQGVVDNLTATVLGTAFDMTRDAGFLTVSVDHGMVQVAVPNSSGPIGERLTEGDWLSFDEGSQRVERGKRDIAQIAAWRDGVIVAERETIAAVTARIRRWYSGRILIAVPSFGSRRISGVFNLNNPIAALEAVVHPYGGTVRQISPWLTIVSPI